MGRSKDYFIQLMESLMQSRNQFLEQMKEMFQDENNLELKTFEVNIGKYKTVLKAWFTKDGRLAQHSYETEYLPSEDEKRDNEVQALEGQKQQALDEEDYQKAAELRDRIKALKKSTT